MLKFPTPKYKLDSGDGENVYPPSEDTFLLMDAMEKERDVLINLNPLLSLEIGSGSGVVTTFLHQLLSSKNDHCPSTTLAKTNLFSICTDLNKGALKCTKRTAIMNLLSLEFLDLINCNILDPLIPRLKNSIDLLLLNPPYVPTEENASKEEEYSYAGGIRGRNLIDKILPIMAELLTPKGLFYLVALKENGVNELLSAVETKNKFGLIGTMIIERKCQNEHLYIIKYIRSNDKATPTMQPIHLPNFTHTGKITLHLKPIGAAPQLKKEYTKYKVDANWTIFQLQQIIKRFLGIKPSDSLFIFVKEAFSPSPEHMIGDLHQCFGSENGILYVQYCLSPAWG